MNSGKKAVTSLLMLLLTAFLITGCGGQNTVSENQEPEEQTAEQQPSAEESQEETETQPAETPQEEETPQTPQEDADKNSVWNDFTFTYRDTEITLPCSYAEFEELTGLKIKKNVVNELQPGASPFSDAAQDGDEHTRISVNLFNPNEEPTVETECLIQKVEQLSTMIDKENPVDAVEFPGGLYAGMEITKEELYERVGREPDTLGGVDTEALESYEMGLRVKLGGPDNWENLPEDPERLELYQSLIEEFQEQEAGICTWYLDEEVAEQRLEYDCYQVRLEDDVIIYIALSHRPESGV